MHNKRVLYPFLTLLFTTAAFAVVLFSCFLNSSPLVRLVQGPTASVYSLPTWLQYCLLHPALLKTLGRLGFGFSLLGSMLTLFLLLRTEPSEIAFKYLAGIGWAVLLTTGAFFLLIFGIVLIFIRSNLHSFGPLGQQLYLRSLAIDSGKALLAIGALVFVIATILTSLTKIWGRLRKPAARDQAAAITE